MAVYGTATYGASTYGAEAVTAAPAPGSIVGVPRGFNSIVDEGETYSSDTLECRVAGVLADPTAVSVAITLPDGEAVAPFNATRYGPGIFAFEFTAAGPQVQSGVHRFIATATGGAFGSSVRRWVGAWLVDGSTQLLSVREAARHIGLSLNSEQDAETLRWLCVAATDAIGRDLGRTMNRTTVTEVYDGGRPHILLRSSPIVSISQVVESGTVIVSSSGGADDDYGAAVYGAAEYGTDGIGAAGVDYTLDPSAGILYRGNGYGCWAPGRQNVIVTYVVGYTNPPPILKRVALLIVEQAWQSGQQLPASSFDGASLESAALNATTLLSPVERAAYNSLRAPAFA